MTFQSGEERLKIRKSANSIKQNNKSHNNGLFDSKLAGYIYLKHIISFTKLIEPQVTFLYKNISLQKFTKQFLFTFR